MNLKNRRHFLQLGFLSTAVFVMQGCELSSITTSRDTIKILQNDLFPKAQELDINTINYIYIVLKHSRIDQEEKTFLKNGVKWLNETALELYKSPYTKLSDEKRQLVLQNISQTQWGESWIDLILRYTLEAALGDPIYGGNNKEAGWKWLEHASGLPRPKRAYL